MTTRWQGGQEVENHLVRVEFSFDGTWLDPIVELEDQLMETIEQANVGELDGNEVGEGKAVLFMYGPDADALLHAILPVLRHPSSYATASS